MEGQGGNGLLLLDLEEAVGDSPMFRQRLHAVEEVPRLPSLHI